MHRTMKKVNSIQMDLGEELIQIAVNMVNNYEKKLIRFLC